VVGQQNADIADSLQLRDGHGNHFFVVLYMGCTLSPPGEYELNRPCAAAMRLYVK